MADKSPDTQQNTEQKFPTEFIDLPSGGKLYPENSPLQNGKIEIKYMTAKEEDILTSQNLIKKGIVLEALLNSLIVTPGINQDDLFIGDKNAILIASRILAYGADYQVELTNPNTGDTFEHNFNLSELDYKPLPDNVDYSKNEFEIELPVSKSKVIFKLLNGRDEKNIENELKAMNKVGSSSREITTRLRNLIISVDGNKEQGTINAFVDNMLSRDSLSLRREVARITPDIELQQTVDIDGDDVEVALPMSANFFWPSADI
jgi:hypothetical protein